MKHNRDVPVGAIGVHAHFDSEVPGWCRPCMWMWLPVGNADIMLYRGVLRQVDASTVKHRLDVLHEVQLPVYVTDLSISNRALHIVPRPIELERFARWVDARARVH